MNHSIYNLQQTARRATFNRDNRHASKNKPKDNVKARDAEHSDLLGQLNELHNTGLDTGSEKVTTSRCNGFIRMLTHSSDGNGSAERSNSILQAMESIAAKHDKDSINSNRGTVGPVPDTQTYNLVIASYVKSGDSYKARKVLQRMESAAATSSLAPKPNIESYLLLQPLTTIPTSPKTINIVKEIQRKENTFLRNSPSKTTTLKLNKLLKSYVKLQTEYGATQAESLLRIMGETSQKLGYMDVLPDLISFNYVIEAWAKSGVTNAGERAFATMKFMKDISQTSGNTSIEPDKHTLVRVIHAFRHSSNYTSMPNHVNALTDLLKQLEDRYHQTKDINCKPDVAIYSSYISYLTHSPSIPNLLAARKAKQYLDHLESQQQFIDNNHDALDSKFYFVVLRAYSKSANIKNIFILDDVLTMHQRMQNLNIEPTVTIYFYIIKILSQYITTNNPAIYDTAQQIFDEYQAKYVLSSSSNENNHNDLHKFQKIPPKREIYNSYLAILSRSNLTDACVKADGILHQMKCNKEMFNDAYVGPNSYSYAKAIDTWASSSPSQFPNKTQRVHELLLELSKKVNCKEDDEEENESISIVVYTSALHACATVARPGAGREENNKEEHQQNKEKAFQNAMQIYKMARSSLGIKELDPAFYRVLLKCCFLINGPTRNKYIARIFQDCCDCHCVNANVFNELQRVAPARLVQQLIGVNIKNVNDLPDEWKYQRHKKKHLNLSQKKTFDDECKYE